ncbi:MAG: hypothetical protein ACOC97_03015 [Myxococcota bacterium]
MDQREKEGLVDQIRAMIDRAGELDPSPYVFGGAEAELRSQVADPLAAVVDEALEVASQLEAAPTEVDGPHDTGNLDLAFGERAQYDDAPITAADHTEGQDVAAMCFALQHELQPVRHQLSAGHSNQEQLLVLCDRARRKLRRSLRALAHALARQAGEDIDLGDEGDVEVSAAVAVRYMYGKFRRALPACDGESSLPGISRCLRRAATALAMLIGDEDFAEVRVADRLLLRELQQRTLSWGRNPDAAEGRRIYSDICSAAELLRGINMRQELRRHDADLLAELAAHLERPDLTAAELRNALVRMRALHGMDDELDALLASAYAGEPLEGLMSRLRQCVSTLHGAMRGSFAVGGIGGSAGSPF